MDYENIKHDAEQTTRKWNTIYLIVMILLLIFIGILGFDYMQDKSNTSKVIGLQMIVLAVVGIVSVKLLCALTDTIANISVKLDKLERMQSTLKKIESNQDRLTRHLDE